MAGKKQLDRPAAIRARDAGMQVVATTSVSALPDGWRVADASPDADGVGLFGPAGEEIQIRPTRARWVLTAFGPPYRGAPLNLTTGQRPLRICVRPARTVPAIAEDVLRRLIPRYREEYDRQRVRIREWIERDRSREALARELAALSGGILLEPAFAVRVVDPHGARGARFEVESNGEVRMNATSLSAADARALARVLGATDQASVDATVANPVPVPKSAPACFQTTCAACGVADRLVVVTPVIHGRMPLRPSGFSLDDRDESDQEWLRCLDCGDERELREYALERAAEDLDEDDDGSVGSARVECFVEST